MAYTTKKGFYTTELIRIGEPANRPYDKCRKVKVTVTLTDPSDFQVKSIPELRKKKLKRIIREAETQGGVFTIEELSNLLCTDKKVIAQDLRELKKEGIKTRRDLYQKPKRKTREDILKESIDRLPFELTQDKDFRETLDYLCRKCLKLRNRQEKYVRNIPRIVANIILRANGKSYMTDKEKQECDRLLRELAPHGIYIGRGNVRWNRRVVERVGKKFHLNEDVVNLIKEVVERETPKSKFKFAHCAAIFYIGCLRSGIKLDMKEIAESFGLPLSVFKRAYEEYKKKPLIPISNIVLAFKKSTDPEELLNLHAKFGLTRKEIFRALIPLYREELKYLSIRELLILLLSESPKHLKEIYREVQSIKYVEKPVIRGVLNKGVGEVFERLSRGYYKTLDESLGIKILHNVIVRSRK